MRYDLVILGTDPQAAQAVEIARAHRLRTAIVGSQRVECLAASRCHQAVGRAEFACHDTVQVHTAAGTCTLSADAFLIATGTRAFRPSHLPLDDRRIVDADWRPLPEARPCELAIVGQDAIALSRAFGWARLGAQVTLIGALSECLAQLPAPVAVATQQRLDALGIDVIPSEVLSLRRYGFDEVELQLDSGDTLIRQVAMLVTQRIGNTGELNLAAAGLACDETGRLWCDSDHRTWSPNIFAAGDVMGFPAAAARFANGGTRAVQSLLGLPLDPPELFEIPEWSPGRSTSASEISKTPSGKNSHASDLRVSNAFPRLWSPA